MNKQFNTFYYTDAFISDRRTLTLLSILSDSVYLYYLSPHYFLKPLERRWNIEKEEPFFKKSPCEDELMTTIHHQKHLKFISDNRELVNAGVISPILIRATPPDWRDFQQYEEKLMKEYSGIGMAMWGSNIGLVPEDKIYVDTPYFSLYRWQSFSGALYFAIKANITPISDNSSLSAIACESVKRFSDLDIEFDAEDLSKLLGFKALSSSLPNFGGLRAEQILELRDCLRNELMAFRYEMHQMVLQSEGELNSLDQIIKFRIEPKLEDIKSKITFSKKALFRKVARTILALGASATLLTQFVSLPTYAQVATGIGFIGKTLLDYSEFRSAKEEILSKSETRGLVLLLKLGKYG